MKFLGTILLLIAIVSLSLRAEEIILASNEAYTGFGDFSSGWQSFTVKENVSITRVDLFVKAAGVGEDFTVNLSEYDPWQGVFGISSESKTVTKEFFNSEPNGKWVSVVWDTPRSDAI